MAIEKNDVDISKLFDWGRVFEVTTGKSKKRNALIYMKLLGDADINKARVYALRKSAELRRNLSTEGTDENLVLIRGIDEMEESDLLNYIGFFSLREIRNRGFREVRITRPVEPKSNASLAKMEKYQKEVDEYPGKVQKALEEFMQKEVELLKKSLEGKPKEELYKKYKSDLITELCEQEAVRAYNDMTTYLGCYKDDTYTEKFFESFEKFDNLPSDFKQQVRAAYLSLEIPQDELKKLREATL